MPRLGPANSNLALPATAGLLLLVAVIPGLGTWWVPSLNRVVDTLTAPPRAAVTWAVGKVRKPGAAATPAEVKLLTEERERWKLLYLQEKYQRERLTAQIEQFQKGLRLNPGLNVRQLVASVIGSTADAGSGLFDVRAGTSSGVEVGAVAAFDGVFLVGRVVRSDSKTCQVLPINDAKGPQINGVIFPFETSSSAPPDPAGSSLACKLNPTRKGTLSGSVYGRTLRPGETLPALTAGMIVRLGDETWPRSAQMLIIGRIEEVQQLPSGREWIVVRPQFDAPLSEVTLRLPEGDSGEGGKP